MIGWMLLLLLLAAFTAPSSGVPQEAVSLGQGVTMTPVEGWVSAADVWDVGPGAVSLRRSGVLVAFAADAFAGTAQGLLDEQLTGLRDQFESLSALPPAATTIAGGVPALKTLFSGTAQSGRLEGELVVVASGGTGVVMLAVAPPGQVGQVQSDLDAMLDSVVLPQ